ncbi:MAG TPA: NAD(P)-dependent oxidoreductase [Steroidobacteraceae bacterium]
MRVLVAGATGAIGAALIPELLRRGHEVFGSTRNLSKAAAITSMGAQPVGMNGLDQAEVLSAVRKVKPDAIVHQMTSLAGAQNLKHFDTEFEQTNQLRTLGTDYLIAAARRSGTRHLVVQSFTGWPNARDGGPIKTETDPLDATPPAAMSRTLAAIRKLEQTVLAITDMHAVVLRYGALYGPGTQISAGGDVVEMVRRRRLPVVGEGGGVWSFIHVADVAIATAQAVEGRPSGLYNIVDDEPAAVRVWLPELAVILGAKAPRRVPSWIARFLIGEPGVSMMTSIRGSANEKAKRLLGWAPVNRSWREGFRRELGNLASRS